MSRWRPLALVIPVVLVLGACAQDEDAPVPAAVATTTAAPPSSSLSSTTTTSSTTSSTATTSSTVPPTTAPPRSPTTAVGGPTDVPEGFCGDLAVESARVTTALEALDPEAALPVRHLVQLRATTALLTWLAEHVPATRRYDAGTLAGGAACGDFPMVSFVADLFAAARLAAGDEERFAVELGL